MKTKRSSINSDVTGSSSFFVDLNDTKVQEKLMHYLRNGVATRDKNGHQIKVQTRCHPMQGDILDSILSKAPKGYWKSSSDLLRSVISIGCFVILNILNNHDAVEDLSKEFKLFELLNMIGKKAREANLHDEARDAIHSLNTSQFDINKLITQLETTLSMTKK